MRFSIWGVKLISFFFIAFVPIFLAFLFHFDLPRGVWGWILPFYVAWSFFWIYFLRRGFFMMRYGFYLTSFLWVFTELFINLYDRQLVRAGFALLAFSVLVIIRQWLELRLMSAPMNGLIPWYEGEPKTLSRVSARVELSGEWVQAKVRRIDEKGLWVLLQDSRFKRKADFDRKVKIPFQISFREHSASGEASLVSLFLTQHIGLGLLFLPKDLYHFSQYTLLVESLRGEGYAS